MFFYLIVVKYNELVQSPVLIRCWYVSSRTPNQLIVSSLVHLIWSLWVSNFVYFGNVWFYFGCFGMNVTQKYLEIVFGKLSVCVILFWESASLALMARVGSCLLHFLFIVLCKFLSLLEICFQHFWCVHIMGLFPHHFNMGTRNWFQEYVSNCHVCWKLDVLEFAVLPFLMRKVTLFYSNLYSYIALSSMSMKSCT